MNDLAGCVTCAAAAWKSKVSRSKHHNFQWIRADQSKSGQVSSSKTMEGQESLVWFVVWAVTLRCADLG